MKNICSASVIALIFLPIESWSMDKDLASYYATALMASFKAEKVCTGMTRNDARFAYLLSKVGQRPEDEPAMKDALREAAAGLQSGLNKVGAAEWCSNIWRLYGPDGPGLLVRR